MSYTCRMRLSTRSGHAVTHMAGHVKLLGAGAIALGALAACGDDAAGPSGPDGDGAGATGGSATGAGGAGGGEPLCEIGSHDDGTGVCVAELSPFQATSELTDARDHHVTFTADKPGGKFVYVIGGMVDMMAAVYSIERSTVAPDGSLGAWETLPSGLGSVGPMVASTGTTVLVAGGVRSSGVSRKTNLFTIGDDGSLAGPTDGPDLLDARFHGAAVLVNGVVYATGGLDPTGTSLATTETATLSDAGGVGAWTPGPDLPLPTSHHGLAAWGDYLFVTGGLHRIDNDSPNDVNYDTVWRSKIEPGGGLSAWEEIGTLPTTLGVHASFAHAGQLYLMHGLELDGLSFLKTVQRAPIGADGSIGAWETLTHEISVRRGHCHQTPILDGVLYSIGGASAAGSQTESFFARFE